MNPTQHKLIRRLQWIIYPIAILMAASTFLPYFFEELAPLAHVSQSITWLLDHVLMLGLLLFFSLILLSFIWYAVTKNRRQPIANPIVILKNPQPAAGYLVWIVSLIFVVGVNMLLFAPEVWIDEAELAEIDLPAKAAFGFFYVLSHFLFVMFGIRAFHNPPYFVMNKEGFLYEPGDVSMGFILWKDVLKMEETEVLYGGSYSGPTTEPVLAITLKNPEFYRSRYPAPLRLLTKMGGQFHQYQTEGKGGDILVNPADFGRRYAEIKQKMQELIASFN